MSSFSIKLIYPTTSGPAIKEFKIPEQEPLDVIESTLPDDELVDHITGLVIEALEKKLEKESPDLKIDFLSIGSVELPDHDSGGDDIQGSVLEYSIIDTEMRGILEPALSIHLRRKADSSAEQTVIINPIVIEEKVIRDKKVDPQLAAYIRNTVTYLLYEAVPLLANRARARGFILEEPGEL